MIFVCPGDLKMGNHWAAGRAYAIWHKPFYCVHQKDVDFRFGFMLHGWWLFRLTDLGES